MYFSFFPVNIEDNEQKRRKRDYVAQNVQQQQQHQPNQQSGMVNGVKRATDDYHYDKFKKQFRRY